MPDEGLEAIVQITDKCNLQFKQAMTPLVPGERADILVPRGITAMKYAQIRGVDIKDYKYRLLMYCKDNNLPEWETYVTQNFR